jgi:hypothetical protein
MVLALGGNGFARAHQTMNTTIANGATAPVVDFPSIIQTALARLGSSLAAGLDQLTSRQRFVLVWLARNISVKDPAASVAIRVETLANASRTSVRTTHRDLAALVELGWITRTQVMSRRHGMQVAETTFTQHALQFMGLLDVRPTRQSSASATVADPEGNSFSAVSYERQPIPGRVENEQPEQPTAVTSTDTRPVQDDVKPLVECGLKPGQVFALMGAATEAGHRLGHIVAAALPLIRKAKSVYGYVKSLIAQDRDWSTHRCAELRREDAKVEEVEQKREKSAARQAIEAALAGGRLLTNAARSTVWTLRCGAVYALPVEQLGLDETRRRYAIVTDLEKMAAALQAGRLVAY